MNASLPILGATLAGALLAGCGGDAIGIEDGPPAAVTIRTSTDFATPPFGGTFVVPRGADRLGCRGGSFVNTPARLGPREMMATRFACEQGPEEGTFTAAFRPTRRLGAAGVRGRWTILEGSGAFSGVVADGAFTMRFTGPGTGEGSMQIEW